MQPINAEFSSPTPFKNVLVRKEVIILEGGGVDDIPPQEVTGYEYAIAYHDGEVWRDENNRRLLFQPDEWVLLEAGFLVVPDTIS